MGTGKFTRADLAGVPANIVGELVAGVLHTSPRPAPRHEPAASSIGVDVGGPFHRGRGGPGGWWILDEPELELHDDTVVPDLAGWRRERMPALPRGPTFTTPPDWVCEVLSPSTTSFDRATKMPLYARVGAVEIDLAGWWDVGG